MGQIQSRCGQELSHHPRAAHRAFEQPGFALMVEILCRGKPALEGMLVLAAKIEDFQKRLQSRVPWTCS